MLELGPGVWRANKEDALLYPFRFPSAKSVVNLQTGFWEILFDRDCNVELRACISLKIRLFDYALSGLLPPARKDIESILWVISDPANQPVVFHCRAHRERTGYVAAVYRLYQGWPFEKAYQEWRATGCRWVTWKLWKRSLKQWEIK
jgi:hypothetical protein